MLRSLAFAVRSAGYSGNPSDCTRFWRNGPMVSIRSAPVPRDTPQSGPSRARAARHTLNITHSPETVIHA